MTEHMVSHVTQSERMSCWAASTAMMYGWQQSQSWPEEQILEQFRHFGYDGTNSNEALELAQAMGMSVVAGACRGLDDWAALIARGPVMVGIPGHWIVVSGMSDDMNQLYVHDPARGEFWADWTQVEAAYEMAPDFVCDMMQF
ncbi:MAG: hypothetical protein H0W25_11465 [Acidimicrobiia bacterium]|nr:hypothetical protein [Acidimicrobiia bacterium]